MPNALCPYCLSKLNITEEQLTLRAGLVRCSNCNDVFNAYKNKLSETDQKPVQKSTEEQKPAAEAPVKPSVTAKPSIKVKPKVKPKIKIKPKPLPPENLGVSHSALKAKEEAKVATWEPSKKESTHLLPFSFAALFLTLLIAGQIIYIQLDVITQTPRFRPFLKQLNSTFDLKIPPYKNASEIQVIERQISAHATVKDALTLQLTMKNMALSEQNFPNINIVLTSNSGEEIARGTFTKLDYLKKDEVHSFFEPQALKQVNLNFNEAQKGSSGFEISFSF